MIPKKPSTGPQHPPSTKPVPEPHPSSVPKRLKPPTKVAKGGPGQTWVNFTKKDIDEYARAHPQSQDKEQDKKTGQSLLGS